MIMILYVQKIIKFIQNFGNMQSISIILTLFYLLRTFNHISSRSKWYIALLLILFFLTSTYEKTFLGFIFDPELDNFKFNGLNNLISNWLSGGQLPVLLSGILFLITKSSLFKLSKQLFFELILVSLATTFILIKVLSPISYIPILFSIIVAMYFNYIKVKNLFFKFRSNYISTIYKGINHLVKSNILIFFSIIYLIYSVFTISTSFSLSLLSPAHIYRILFFFIPLLILFVYDKLSSKKMIIGIIPTISIYLGLIVSSFLTNKYVLVTNESLMTLESLTAIALFPLIEVIQGKYYLINSYMNIVPIFRIRNYLFKYTVKILLSIIVLTYILYLFTQ